jgi:hypothetical protein
MTASTRPGSAEWISVRTKVNVARASRRASSSSFASMPALLDTSDGLSDRPMAAFNPSIRARIASAACAPLSSLLAPAAWHVAQMAWPVAPSISSDGFRTAWLP